MKDVRLNRVAGWAALAVMAALTACSGGSSDPTPPQPVVTPQLTAQNALSVAAIAAKAQASLLQIYSAQAYQPVEITGPETGKVLPCMRSGQVTLTAQALNSYTLQYAQCWAHEEVALSAGTIRVTPLDGKSNGQQFDLDALQLKVGVALVPPPERLNGTFSGKYTTEVNSGVLRWQGQLGLKDTQNQDTWVFDIAGTIEDVTNGSLQIQSTRFAVALKVLILSGDEFTVSTPDQSILNVKRLNDSTVRLSVTAAGGATVKDVPMTDLLAEIAKLSY